MLTRTLLVAGFAGIFIGLEFASLAWIAGGLAALVLALLWAVIEVIAPLR